MITTTRRFSFKSVHSLHTGLHRERRHGHHYTVEITFAGQARAAVELEVENLIQARLHGHELKGDLEPATGEVLVNWIHERLAQSPVGPAVFAVALQETRKNRFVSARSRGLYV